MEAVRGMHGRQKLDEMLDRTLDKVVSAPLSFCSPLNHCCLFYLYGIVNECNHVVVSCMHAMDLDMRPARIVRS
jgi:hypothetical protein